jgi:hypothetical protein
VRQVVFQDGQILSILDTDAANRSVQVRAVARDLAIELMFIPGACADRTQPRDPIQQNGGARRMWTEHYRSHRTHREKITKVMIAERLIETWNRITAETSSSDWEIVDSQSHAGGPADDKRRDLDDDTDLMH